jgi:Rap1a immunity proteins
MKWQHAILTAGVITIAATNSALAFNGVDLNNACADKKNGAGDLTCTAYIRGVSEGFMRGLALSDKLQERIIYCPPTDGVSAEQARLIVEKYIRDHPKKLNEQASFLIEDALLGAFPCRKTENQIRTLPEIP